MASAMRQGARPAGGTRAQTAIAGGPERVAEQTQAYARRGHRGAHAAIPEAHRPETVALVGHTLVAAARSAGVVSGSRPASCSPRRASRAWPPRTPTAGRTSCRSRSPSRATSSRARSTRSRSGHETPAPPERPRQPAGGGARRPLRRATGAPCGGRGPTARRGCSKPTTPRRRAGSRSWRRATRRTASSFRPGPVLAVAVARWSGWRAWSQRCRPRPPGLRGRGGLRSRSAGVIWRTTREPFSTCRSILRELDHALLVLLFLLGLHIRLLMGGLIAGLQPQSGTVGAGGTDSGQTLGRRPSSAAHAAKQSAPTVPVTVSRTPAAAVAATPPAPRMRTTAAAPTLGPIGSWLSVTIAIRTAVASKSEASTRPRAASASCA